MVVREPEDIARPPTASPATDAPTRLPAAERRQQLLGVARQVLAREGYYETTMAQIADGAGVTKPVLYQHFASKRDLYTAVLVDIGDRLRAAIFEAAVEAETPRQQVNAGFRGYVDFVDDDPDGFKLLFSGASRQDPEWSSITRGVESSIASGIADLIVVPEMSSAHRHALANAVMGMAEGMMRYYWQSGRSGDLERDELVDDLIALAWGGLRGLRT